MKKLSVTFFLLCITAVGFGQMLEPVKWSYHAEKTSTGKFAVYLTAVLDGAWHIYSQYTAKGGPTGVNIRFNPNPLISLNGKPKEIGQVKKNWEDLFGKPLIVSYFN